MSDEENINQNEVEEELDDLFGDGDDNEDKVEESPVKSDNEEVDDRDEDDDEDDEESETTKQFIDISLPRHAITQHMEKDVSLLKTPDFLNLEAHPFDPTAFKEQIEENQNARKSKGLTAKEIHNEQITEKLLNENTIRWRYHNAGNDDIIKQSNAHFVAWNDGSVSLKVGNEIYDVRELPLYDHILVRSYETAEILQSDSIISKTMNLLPASSAHRKILVKNITKKEKILNTITDVDPLEKQRIADENARKAMKLKRQLESKRRLQDEKWERSASPGFKNQGSSYEVYSEKYEEDDDDGYGGDGFVAADEEEIELFDDDDEDEDADEEEFEKGAERLRKVKEEGAAKYRTPSQEPDDEDERIRKRRRIIDSDEE